MRRPGSEDPIDDSGNSCYVFAADIYVNENLCSNKMGIKLGLSYANLTLSYAKLKLLFVQLPSDFVECTKVHSVLLLVLTSVP